MYVSNSNHGFILSELLQYWEADLNGYNYIIKPKYFRNPYNQQLFHPMEIYKVLYFCSIYNVKIPLSISFFIKKVHCLVETYYAIKNESKEDQENHMRILLNKIGLKYVGGRPENNIAGKWDINITNIGTIYEETAYLKNAKIPLVMIYLLIVTAYENMLVYDNTKFKNSDIYDEELIIEDEDDDITVEHNDIVYDFNDNIITTTTTTTNTSYQSNIAML